jgi:hypothetical protein
VKLDPAEIAHTADLLIAETGTPYNELMVRLHPTVFDDLFVLERLAHVDHGGYRAYYIAGIRVVRDDTVPPNIVRFSQI